MQATSIAIIGAGLAGLYAACLLEKRGFTDYILLEARDKPGGRIASIEGLDLGPAWFWPGLQRQMDVLVRELGLEYFPQHETGDMIIERSRNEAPFRTRGYASSPPSMRLTGGMAALVEALLRHVDPDRIVTGQVVRRLSCAGDEVEAGGWRAQHVLLALPPRLAMQLIEFVPALPETLADQWRETPTWMAPHAKYIAVYDRPFWRDIGLSGEARSGSGPLGEIHDASLPDGRAALFGFFGMPAGSRKRVPDDDMRLLCRAQMGRLFGAEAGVPRADYIKDWALEAFTAAHADLDGAGLHAVAPAAVPSSGPWQGRITGIASEWSPQFAGYLAGAIEAVQLGTGGIK